MGGKSPDDYAPAFGRYLATVREGRGTTQAELADLAGVGKTTISYLENGHRLPDLTTLVRLLHALGVTLHDLADAVEGPRGAAPAEVAEPPADYANAQREAIRAEILTVLDELIAAQRTPGGEIARRARA